MSKSVMLLELNELTPALMDQFIAQGHLPGFARLRSESLSCVTDAEEEGDTLEPWIQWVTIHTGLSYADHKVFDLSDGPRYAGPRIWDRVSDAGHKVWVCGSMNAATQKDINGMVLPDPWATAIRPQPAALFDPYFKLVSSYVQEYTRDKAPVTPAQYLNFARFMAANGLSPKTIAETLSQLSGELGGTPKWKRATILDRLQWDVFRHHYRQMQPKLSTFFLNSTAHFQHYYWRNLQPEHFAHQPDAAEQAEKADAILYGYQKMDKIVQEAMALAGPDTTIIFCTGLSQQPLLKYEDQGGKLLFKPLDQAELVRFAGISARYTYAPVMAEEFFLKFETSEDAAAATERMLALKLSDGQSVMKARQEGSDVFCGCNIIQTPVAGAMVSTPFSNQQQPFDKLFYPVEGVKSGGHHPDGMLWIRTPQRARGSLERKVSLLEIAPTVMHLCGLSTDGFSMPVMPEVLNIQAVSQAA